jgi:hypothetical protein
VHVETVRTKRESLIDLALFGFRHSVCILGKSQPYTTAQACIYDRTHALGGPTGMTRLGLVLHDEKLTARSTADIQAVIKGGFFGEPGGGGPEGWPRSVYSRAILAYYDATGDEKVLPFFSSVWNASYTMDKSADARSMTQAEAMLEG